MKCILIDDEPDSLELLDLMIKKYCPELDVLGQYSCPRSGIEAIWDQRPDLVFLDVDMPEINGFGVLEACKKLPFLVIFTTAYDKYAVQAFKCSATDFLLKPIDRMELIAAVEKAKRQKSMQQLEEQRELLFKYLDQSKPTREKIAFPTSEGIVFLKVADIEYFEASGNYCIVYTTDNPRGTLFVRSLREIEEMLLDNNFIRTHNSYLVNLDKVKRYIRGDGGDLEMSNDKKVPIARHKKKVVLERMGKL
ncbi:MAG: LytTR family DNA-binding domain-containing protein [Saprospiraceae bacterium]